MNMKIWVGLVLGSLISFAASASPFSEVSKDSPICYSSEYSAEHLKKHPKQTVKEMKIKIYKGTEDYDSDQLYLAVQALVKPKGSNDYKPYQTGMACTEIDGRLLCNIDCDGGSAVVRPSMINPGEWMRLENNGFVMYGGCGEEVNEEDSIYLTPTKGGDDLFMLKKMKDQKACKAIKAWEVK